MDNRESQDNISYILSQAYYKMCVVLPKSRGYHSYGDISSAHSIRAALITLALRLVFITILR